MNILILSYLYPGKKDLRLGLFVHEQAKELKRQGHDVTVVTVGEKDGKEMYEGISVYRVRPWAFLKGLSFNIKSLSAIKGIAKKIDIVHLHFIGINTIFPFLSASWQ